MGGGSTFWGLVVKNGDPSAVEIDDSFCLKVAQVTLASGKKDATTSLYVTANKQKVLLCNLSSHADFHQFNDLSFMDEDSPVTFEIQGSGEVHLQGYMVSAVDESDDERLAAEMEMESSEEEQEDEEEDEEEEEPIVKGKPAVNGASARKDKLATAVAAQLKRQHAEVDSEEEDSQGEGEEEGEEETKKPTKGKASKKSEKSDKSAPPAKKAKGDDKKASGGQHVCSHCQRGFGSPAGLQQHSKDKHPA